MSANTLCIPGMRAVIAVAGAIVVSLGAASGAYAATPPRMCDAANVVANALPGVVNISVIQVITKTRADGSPEEHLEINDGAGAIIDPSGIIVTNRHKIGRASCRERV